jgi:hypothetical protein
MTTVKAKNGKMLGVGCWYDSAHSASFIGSRVQEEAREAGWQGKVERTRSENFFFAWDEAEDYLNDNIAPEFYYFGSNDNGDWGLWQMNCEDSGYNHDWIPNVHSNGEIRDMMEDNFWEMPVFCQSCGRRGKTLFTLDFEKVEMEEV